jgi:hypothetical protein
LIADAACTPPETRVGERVLRGYLQTVREFFDDEVLADPETGAIRRLERGIFMAAKDLAA